MKCTINTQYCIYHKLSLSSPLMEYITSYCYNQINCKDGLKKNIITSHFNSLSTHLELAVRKKLVIIQPSLCKNVSTWTLSNRSFQCQQCNIVLDDRFWERKDQTGFKPRSHQCKQSTKNTKPLFTLRVKRDKDYDLFQDRYLERFLTMLSKQH